MTCEEQDKLWAELSEERKDSMRAKYAGFYAKNTPESKGYCQGLANVFGEHNLKPALTYEDVASELFKSGYCYYDYVYDDIVSNSAACEMPMACTSSKQVKKICAINKLLNVAKYLNKEDGSDWVPDWNYVQDKWYLAVEKGKVKVDYHDNGHNSHIVYFRTEEIAQRAIEILGEDTIRTALGNY